MSISQKIYELRSEIMKSHPRAKLVKIVLNVPAEYELIRQLGSTTFDICENGGNINDSHRLDRIFDIEIDRDVTK